MVASVLLSAAIFTPSLASMADADLVDRRPIIRRPVNSSHDDDLTVLDHIVDIPLHHAVALMA